MCVCVCAGAGRGGGWAHFTALVILRQSTKDFIPKQRGREWLPYPRAWKVSIRFPSCISMGLARSEFLFSSSHLVNRTFSHAWSPFLQALPRSWATGVWFEISIKKWSTKSTLEIRRTGWNNEVKVKLQVKVKWGRQSEMGRSRCNYGSKWNYEVHWNGAERSKWNYGVKVKLRGQSEITRSKWYGEVKVHYEVKMKWGQSEIRTTKWNKEDKMN